MQEAFALQAQEPPSDGARSPQPGSAEPPSSGVPPGAASPGDARGPQTPSHGAIHPGHPTPTEGGSEPGAARALQSIVAQKDAVIAELEAALQSSRRQVALLRDADGGGAAGARAAAVPAAAAQALDAAAQQAAEYRAQAERARRDFRALLAKCAVHTACVPSDHGPPLPRSLIVLADGTRGASGPPGAPCEQRRSSTRRSPSSWLVSVLFLRLFVAQPCASVDIC